MNDERERLVSLIEYSIRCGGAASESMLVLTVIRERIKTMIVLHDMCVPLEEHWRAADTGEMFTGTGDDVGECEAGCPVNALESVGLVEVRTLKRCPRGHEWYGDGCPKCSGDELL